MSRSARRLWAPRLLWQPPVDAFKQISQLCRRDRHRVIRAVARSARRPDEAAALQPLRVQAHALAVVPQHLNQRTAPAAKDEQVPAMRIALELLLGQQRQSIKALAHVRVAGRKPHPNPARDRNHRRRSLRTTAAIAAEAVAASTKPVMRSRAPLANSISIIPGGAAETRSFDATATAAKRTASARTAPAWPVAAMIPARAWRRHR